MEIRKLNLLNIFFINMSSQDILRLIHQAIMTSQPLKICYLDEKRFFHALFSESLRSNINMFDIVIPYGESLIRYLKKINPNYPYAHRDCLDLIGPILDKYKNSDINFMICGASQIGANKLGINLNASFPGIRIMGVYSKPFFKARTDDIRALILKGDVRVLYLGLNTPQDETWVIHNQDVLSRVIALCVNKDVEALIAEYRESPKHYRMKGKKTIQQIIYNLITFHLLKAWWIDINIFFFTRRMRKNQQENP